MKTIKAAGMYTGRAVTAVFADRFKTAFKHPRYGRDRRTVSSFNIARSALQERQIHRL